MTKFLELLKIGQFKDRHGKMYNITKDVLNKISSTFNQQTPPAILVGHPDKPQVPSFGFVDAVKVVGDKLLFRPGKVVAEFAELVKKGGFPAVSAGLTPELDRLDHVAFLSAQKPAIDGLEPVAEFSVQAVDKTGVQLEGFKIPANELAEFTASDDWTARQFQRTRDIFRAIKNLLIESVGVDKVEPIISEWDLERLGEEPPKPEEAAEFSQEDNKLARSVSFDTKHEELLAQIEAVQAQNAALAQKIRLAEFSSVIEDAITRGKVLPDQKQAAIVKMETHFMASQKLKPPCPEFSESDKPSHAETLDVFTKYYESSPRIAPELGEMKTPPEFALLKQTSGAPPDLGKRAQAYIAEMRAKGITVDAIAAVRHVKKEFNFI